MRAKPEQNTTFSKIWRPSPLLPNLQNKPKDTPYVRLPPRLSDFRPNSLVRDMMFRANFLIDMVSSTSWVLINVAFYTLIFHYTPAIGVGTGWGKYQFFLFLARRY